MLRRLAVVLICATALKARVTRIVVDHGAPQGKPLTGAGQYELLTGLFYGELDPKDPYREVRLTEADPEPRRSTLILARLCTCTFIRVGDLTRRNRRRSRVTPIRAN